MKNFINRIYNSSVKAQFIALMLSVILLSLASIAIVRTFQVRAQVRNNITSQLRSQMEVSLGILNTVRIYTLQMLDSLASTPGIEELLLEEPDEVPEAFIRYFDALFANVSPVGNGLRVYENAFIFNSNLELIVAAEHRVIPFNLRRNEFVQNVEAALAGRLHTSHVFRCYMTGMNQLLFTQPLFVEGQFRGLVAMIGNTDELAHFLQLSEQGGSNFVIVADQTGTIFFSDRPEYISLNTRDIGIRRVGENITRNTLLNYDSSVTGRGQMAYVAASPVMNWDYISVIDTDAVESVALNVFFSLIPILIGMSLSVVFMVYMLRYALRPLKDLETLAKEVSAGNLDVTFDIRKNDEIARVSRSFIAIVTALKILQDNFKDAESAMMRGDITFRLEDSRLGGDFGKMLEMANAIIREFEVFFELLSEPIVIIDRDMRVRYANKIMRTHTQYEDKKYSGLRINDFVGGDLAAYISDSIRYGTPQLGKELQLQLNPSQLFDLEISCVPFLVGTRVEGAVIILTNVTNLKQMQRQKIEAESASRAKSDFLSKMSHEIRTPMNAIMGTTDILLLKGGHAPETEEALMQIHASSSILLSIINDILDLSKVEAGKMELIIKPYEIASLIFDTVQINLMHLGSKSIKFTLDIDDKIPATLIGDELRIRQIVSNLLSNAFKYTKEGSVHASFGIERDEDKYVLTFKVSDTGQGMTKDQIDAIFGGEYMRFNEKDNHLIEGTGLGINITNRLIHMMEGRIVADSEPDKGTTFSVWLPQGVDGEAVLGKAKAASLCNFQVSQRAFHKRHNFEYEHMPYGSVLVVDDVESNLFVAKGLLLPYGLSVETASSGFEAVDLVKAGKVYDIIFMDHMMPEMDGIETAKMLRDMDYSGHIVALTANTIRGQEELFMKEGFSGFISKPIDVGSLNEYLLSLIRDRYPAEVIAAAKKSAPAAVDFSSAILDSFLRDASRAIDTLTLLLQKPDWDGEDFKKFTINAHGMKSALANVGKDKLSYTAGALERLGREENKTLILLDTPIFLEDLREVIARHTEEQPDVTEEDTEMLHKGLAAIKEACELYNKKDARKALDELNQNTWTKESKALLGDIAARLLHSAFEEAAEEIEKFLEAK